jgi:hypothetical protein
MGLRLVIVRHIGGSRLSRSINSKADRLRALEGCQYVLYHGMLWVYRVGGLWPSQRDLVLGSARRNRGGQPFPPSCDSPVSHAKQVAQSATASVGGGTGRLPRGFDHIRGLLAWQYSLSPAPHCPGGPYKVLKLQLHARKGLTITSVGM